jgi:hypothetical protein
MLSENWGEYGASDEEQELNDLEELSRKVYALSETIQEESLDEVDEKYGFGVVDTLQELSLEIDRKIEELRNPPTREDYILEREGL